MILHVFLATFLLINNTNFKIKEGDNMKVNVDKFASELILALMVLALYLTVMGFVLF